MKRILILQGHPDSESYCEALGLAYAKGAKASDAEVEMIKIRDLDFNPNLEFGYRKRTELEPDLLMAREKIEWSEHIVLIHPVWWGGLPAITKGFFDRTFLPGWAFEKKENSLISWDKMLSGRSARIITTMDQPPLYYRLNFLAPSYRALKYVTFKFVGIKKVKITGIGPIRLSKDSFREKWLAKIEKLGTQNK